jgi:hypothetical protein
VGFILSLAIFMVGFLVTRSTFEWARSVIYASVCIGFMVGIGHHMTLDFPAGLLQSMVELPWSLK